MSHPPSGYYDNHRFSSRRPSVQQGLGGVEGLTALFLKTTCEFRAELYPPHWNLVNCLPRSHAPPPPVLRHSSPVVSRCTHRGFPGPHPRVLCYLGSCGPRVVFQRLRICRGGTVKSKMISITSMARVAQRGLLPTLDRRRMVLPGCNIAKGRDNVQQPLAALACSGTVRRLLPLLCTPPPWYVGSAHAWARVFPVLTLGCCVT